MPTRHKVEWDEGFSVGNAQIDNQHKTFIHMINEVSDLSLKGYEKSAVSLKLMDLMRYSDVHFQTEELKMARGKYPDIEQHMHLHEEFRDNVSRMMLTDGVGLSEILGFMKIWLKEHLINEDKKYEEYIL